VPTVVLALIIVHVVAVLLKLALFFIIPRLANVDEVRNFLKRWRPVQRAADWVLWITGAGLLAFTDWRLLKQTWMLVSIALYLLVFVLIRVALMKELENVAASKKRFAVDEVRRLRTNNWCVGLVSAGLLGVIAYLMITKP
jgi:uncharacterized membrane protein SirB2